MTTLKNNSARNQTETNIEKYRVDVHDKVLQNLVSEQKSYLLRYFNVYIHIKVSYSAVYKTWK